MSRAIIAVTTFAAKLDRKCDRDGLRGLRQQTDETVHAPGGRSSENMQAVHNEGSGPRTTR